ncbi:MAG TPA: alpha-amylase [Phycisphaerales bacterium]|nr:alpha-amylase [Phycisphaerales bacterium]HCD31585.1 alpha-amylase [Phycisphaerales bacterium]|tara:strand:- start:570 stop:1892 length:1323 start_codon:yes stop_codon:yes gene_type:complete
MGQGMSGISSEVEPRKEQRMSTSVCLYFQMHQPMRLRPQSVFDHQDDYIDHALNRNILLRIARNCYVPALHTLLRYARFKRKPFKFALSVTGCLLDQLERHCPEVIIQLRELAHTGCVEFLGETYYHSLACLTSDAEFKAQVDLHTQRIESLFDCTPRFFRNTELVYCDSIAKTVASWGRFDGMLLEGFEQVLGNRPATQVFDSTAGSDFKLLTRHYHLSDDIAFRYSNEQWVSWPLTAQKFVDRLQEQANGSDVVLLGMDFETFGEHHKYTTNIHGFLRSLPIELMEQSNLRCHTPSQAIAKHPARSTLSVPDMISWADTQRDLTAWAGNRMQAEALGRLYGMYPHVLASGDENLLQTWRQLTISDHLYYMCTKHMNDGQVHAYFSPFDSPYDAYINFMNVLEDLASRRLGIETTEIQPTQVEVTTNKPTAEVASDAGL